MRQWYTDRTFKSNPTENKKNSRAKKSFNNMVCKAVIQYMLPKCEDKQNELTTIATYGFGK